MMQRWLLALCALLFVAANSSFAADNDFDADGLADAVFVNEDNVLNWNYYTASSVWSQITSLGTVGSAGEYPAPGNWSNSTQMEVGYISVDRTSGVVTWVALDSEGDVKTKNFGHIGDILVSGGDYNGNGYYGAARITTSGAAQVYTDMFAGGTIFDLTFASRDVSRGKALFLRRNGLNDELCFLRTLRKRNRLVCRDLNGGSSSQRFKRVRGGVDDVMPIATGDGTDYVATVTKRKRNTVVQVFNLNGKRAGRVVFKAKADIVVGEFLGDQAGEELAAYKNGAITLFNPFTKEGTTISNIASTVGTMYDSVNAYSTSAPGGSGNNDDDDLLAQRCPRTEKNVDGNGGWLHKPVSDNTGSIVLLFPASDRISDVSFIRKTGKKFMDLSFSGNSNPNRPTWRPVQSLRCSSFPKNMRVRYKKNGRVFCRKIPNPCSRYD